MRANHGYDRCPNGLCGKPLPEHTDNPLMTCTHCGAQIDLIDRSWIIPR